MIPSPKDHSSRLLHYVLCLQLQTTPQVPQLSPGWWVVREIEHLTQIQQNLLYKAEIKVGNLWSKRMFFFLLAKHNLRSIPYSLLWSILSTYKALIEHFLSNFFWATTWISLFVFLCPFISHPYFLIISFKYIFTSYVHETPNFCRMVLQQVTAFDDHLPSLLRTQYMLIIKS